MQPKPIDQFADETDLALLTFLNRAWTRRRKVSCHCVTWLVVFSILWKHQTWPFSDHHNNLCYHGRHQHSLDVQGPVRLCHENWNWNNSQWTVSAAKCDVLLQRIAGIAQWECRPLLVTVLEWEFRWTALGMFLYIIQMTIFNEIFV